MNLLNHPDYQALVQLVRTRWDSARVLVVGDVMLDRYAFGHVERVSPEAPVPVVRADRTRERPGGAANVAMNLAKLGGVALLAGFVGEDQDGRMLKSLLNEAGVESSLVPVAGMPTTSKLRVLGQKQQIVRLDFENPSPRPEPAYQVLLARVREALPSASAVVISDYDKGTLTPALCQQVITEATKLGIPVLVDPKSKNFYRYAGATTICPNLAELSLATGEDAADVDALLEHGQRFVSDYRLQYLTVKMGEKGIVVLWSEQRYHAAALARQVFDVSGAGDTVIATLAICAANGVDLRLAAELANVTAGIVIGKIGTVPVTQEELLAELGAAAVVKLYLQKTPALSQLLERIAAWRAAGDRIVFTNGCFDLLHVGHVTLLERCKQFGERLIIGINSDASVARLKGPSRPIISETERMRVLSSLTVSDAVVIFDEPTPIELIRTIRPDVLVKGGDYTEATVVWAEDVKGWGGRVELVPLVPGLSTSEIVRRASGA
jgi:D-beta-D-heptose 7-phosphate kinase/D-beta-D-heptose 1-phosphate adenosyltransferase